VNGLSGSRRERPAHHASRTGSSRERSASARWPSCCCCVCACVNSVRCGGWGGAAGRRTSEEERGELGALYRLCGGADSAQRGARASWLLSPQTSALPPTVSVPELPGGRQEERVACCVTRCSIRRETLTVSPGYPATLQKPCAVDPHACLWRIGWVRRG
jgi:hypothetical protein